MNTSIYFRSKTDNSVFTVNANSNSYRFYELALGEGCEHDEAANFQGWAELASTGECYDCIAFYAEVL